MNTGVVTFGEKAGVPGQAFFLPMIENKIRLSVVSASGKVNLPLSAHNTSGGGGELTTSIKATPPFSFNLACIFGIFNDDPKKPVSLLKYYSNADVVTKPNDWIQVQDWNTQEGLEVTLRDPFMKHPHEEFGVHLVSGDQGDECAVLKRVKREACVVAVVRFNGQPIDGNVSVSTYLADGTKFDTTVSVGGVTLVKLPLNASLPFTEVFASANYREPSAGTYGGKKYSVVDHWATTYARLFRDDTVLLV